MAGVRHAQRPMGVRRLPPPDFGDSGNGFSGQPPASDSLVSGSVVGDQPEERSQRHGLAAGAGVKELQDGLDSVA